MTAQDRMDEAVARARERVAANEKVLVCDFCAHAAPDVYAVWTTEGSLLGDVTATGDDGTGKAMIDYNDKWLACDACDPVVASRDPVALAAHAIENRDPAHTAPLPDDVLELVQKELVGLYRAFFALNPTRSTESRNEGGST